MTVEPEQEFLTPCPPSATLSPHSANPSRLMSRQKRILNCRKLSKIGNVLSETSRKIGHLMENGNRVKKMSHSETGAVYPLQICESDFGYEIENKGEERGEGRGGEGRGGWVGGGGDEIPILIGDLGDTEDTVEYQIISNQYDNNSSGRRSNVDGYGRRHSGDCHFENGDLHVESGDFHIENGDFNVENGDVGHQNVVVIAEKIIKKDTENYDKNCRKKKELEMAMSIEENLNCRGEEDEEENKKGNT